MVFYLNCIIRNQLVCHRVDLYEFPVMVNTHNTGFNGET